MPALRELGLSNNNIESFGFKSLFVHTLRDLPGNADVTLALETVDLQGNDITSIDIAFFRLLENHANQQPPPLTCPHLACVALDGNPVMRTPIGREYLQESQAITGVALTHAHM